MVYVYAVLQRIHEVQDIFFCSCDFKAPTVSHRLEEEWIKASRWGGTKVYTTVLSHGVRTCRWDSRKWNRIGSQNGVRELFKCLKSGKDLKSKSVRSNLQATFQIVPINIMHICPPCSCKRFSVSSFICIRYCRNKYGTAFFRYGTGTNFCLLQ